MNCKDCGAAIPAGARQCSRCGAGIEPEPAAPTQAAPPGQVQVIIQTGGGVAPTAGSVATPGQATPVPLIPPKPRSRIVAGLLGIFLGAFGAHRFYLGYKMIGTIQLALTVGTCFYGLIGTAPWGLVEGILILTGKIDKDAYGQPLKD